MQSPTPQASNPSLSRLEQLHDYTYRKVAGVLGECQSPLEPINLSVGEPKFGAYETVGEALAATDPAGWGKYPPVNAGPDLREAVAGWIRRRTARRRLNVGR